MNPQIDIYKSLKTNRIITLSAVIVAGLCITVSVVMAYQFSENILRYTFNNMLTIDKNGEVLPMHLVERNEYIKIEIADHLEKWFDRYYDFDFNNVRTKPLRAQWLIAGDDFKKLQNSYSEWHKELEQKKYIQKAFIEVDSIQVAGNSEPYSFKTSAIISVGNAYGENRYRIKASGKIILVEPNYPKNPHGFLIIDYKESKEKLPQYEELR